MMSKSKIRQKIWEMYCSSSIGGVNFNQKMLKQTKELEQLLTGACNKNKKEKL
jgi:hypothetical protein